MKHRSALLAACLAACLAAPFLAWAVQPPQGAVVFRFDDNHTSADWNAIQQVYRKHRAPMNLAVVTAQLINRSDAAGFLQQVVKDGGEIMDHSPSHSCMKIEFPSAAEARKYKDDPGVERIEGNTVLLKLRIDPTVTYKPQLTFHIRNNQLIPLDDNAKKRLWNGAFLEMPDGRLYGCLKKGGTVTLCTVYGTPCTVPDQQNVKAILTNQNRLQPTDDALRLVAKVSRANFAKLGLPAPVSFILPGGWGILPSDRQLARIYGREFGYIAGDSYNVWGGVYGRKDKEVFRFSMAPCWDSLERKNVEQTKRMIADMTAQHRVVVFISHLWFHTVPGGKAELLKRNDELLTWLRAQNIPVLTMKQASRLLFDTPYNTKINVMPDLGTDRNEDHIPDGYTLAKGTTAVNGTLKRSGTGEFFTVKGLTAVAAGKNLLTCKVKAPAGTKITFTFGNCGRWSTAPAQKMAPVTFTTAKPEEEIRCEFNFPGWAYALQIRCDAESTGAVEFSAPRLTSLN